jgi:hypothetical protein
MNTYIVIDNRDADDSKIDPTVMPVDTEEQRRTAQAELLERGVAVAAVWTGEPPDAVWTGRRLYAD